MKVLGLCGHMGAGKDHVYEYLNRRSVLTVIRIAFADGVRNEVAEAFNLTGGQYEAAFSKPYSDGVRFVLQQWGTEFRRAQDTDYWVKRGMAYAEEMRVVAEDFGTEDELLIVFTDVRFANEAKAIQEIGGKVMRVTAPLNIRQSRLDGRDAPKHASEVIDFEYDAVIGNGIDGRDPAMSGREAVWLGL